MSRASRALSEKTVRVRVGEVDIVSRAVYAARLPLCGLLDTSAPQGFACTRAAGHDESNPGHPSTSHVATGVGFVALAVF